MPRLILPSGVDAVKKLIADIIEKNTAMGAGSPLPLMLTENGISLTADAAAVASAEILGNTAASLSRTAESFTESRILKTDTAMKAIAGIAQLLKAFYKGRLTELGNWGIDITALGKITYPLSAADKLTLVKTIRDKDATYAPDPSPLTAYLAKEDLNLDALVTALTAANTYHEQSKATAAEAENAIEQRNILMEPVGKHIALIGGFLMDFYKGNPRMLGLWGFMVDESTQKPTDVITKMIAGETKTLANCIIGGTFENMGPGEAHVYKGKTATGNPVIIANGEKMVILKGFSTITVSNPSTLNGLTLKILRSK